MLNNSRRYTTMVVGVIGGVLMVETLAGGLKDEYCLINKEPDIPTEHFNPLQPHFGIMVVGTTSATISGDYRIN